ncbi:phosphotransferase [Actinopolymorpha pittospori]|uniref:Phosphotransferase enzyme family protein n=1 Tax=Actinopolymorpha pittospori TaxID=648752 RepID=A0A927RKE5_9ACTN|nr:phosphotransferase [Actinopolymorpha pittospori]MBE1606633.1 hypothetical protein [Actinopolymorpha pittospori]
MPTSTNAVPEVEKLLSASFGVPVAIATVEHQSPWAVLRAILADPAPGLPASVVVKWLREHPNDVRTDPRQVSTERAALEFLAELGFGLAPRLLASDLAARVLVLEDLAPRVPLPEPLLRDGMKGTLGGLTAFARALGELCAVTAGHEERYVGRRAVFGPAERLTDRWESLGPVWKETGPLLASLGFGVPPAAERDLALVRTTLAEPGPFLAFTNGDPEPNNFLVHDGAESNGRIIDFEFAGYVHALFNAAWIHVPGPAWITVADPAEYDLEDAFRLALCAAVPEAADDGLFGLGMSAACVARAVRRLNRFRLLDGRAPGDNSRVQMVATLESAADIAEHHRCLPDLRGWVRDVAGMLRRRWPDADVDLASMPAYTPRG